MESTIPEESPPSVSYTAPQAASARHSNIAASKVINSFVFILSSYKQRLESKSTQARVSIEKYARGGHHRLRF